MEITFLSPIWSALFVVALVTFFVTTFWDSIKNGIEKAKNKDKNSSSFEILRILLVIVRIMVAITIYLFVLIKFGECYAFTTAGVIVLIAAIVLPIVISDTNIQYTKGENRWRFFWFYYITINVFTVSLMSFIFASWTTALSYLAITVLVALLLPKYELYQYR